jgi:hypothetical protein
MRHVRLPAQGESSNRMGAGDRFPTRARRAVHSTAPALAVACVLAIPADAAALPVGAAPLTADPATAPVGTTIDSTPSSLGGATGDGKRLVADAALVAVGARPALEAAVRRAAETAAPVGSGAPPATGAPGTDPPGSAAPPDYSPAQNTGAQNIGGAAPAPAARKSSRLTGRGPARAAHTQPRRMEEAQRSGHTSPLAIPPAAPAPATGLGAAPRGAGPDAGTVNAGLEPPSGPGLPPAGSGTGSMSSTAAGLSLGGLAVLLAALSLARPALTRRLQTRRPARWPAAFVPLPERPG